MARETIFEAQKINDFAYSSSWGAYAWHTTPSPFVLELGETYIISWDGEEFERTAFDFSVAAPGAVGVGNAYLAGVSPEPDLVPFIIAYLDTTDYIEFITSASGGHTVAIYKEIAEPEKIIIKDPDGNDVEYTDKPMIRLNTTKGTALYSKGEVLDSITIEPDFAAGDMTVSAPDGYLVKSAVIAKPASLVPENIPVGINIAGVDGAREEAGGGSTDCVEWLQVAQYATRQQATTVTGTISVTIPKDCLEWAVLKMYQTFSGSSSITISSATTPTVEFGEAGLTVTEDETHITVSYTKTWSSSVSSVKYKYMLMQLVIAFVMGNMYIDSSGGSNVLIGKPALRYLPIATSTTMTNCAADITKIDFSQTAIEKYERLTADYDKTLTKVLLPSSCYEIGAYAFYRCNMVSTIAEAENAALNTVNLPHIKKVNSYGFSQIASIKYVYLAECETLAEQAFYQSTAIVTVDLPKAKTVGRNAFYGCTGITSVNAPMLEDIGQTAFYGCTKLTGIALPSVKNIVTGAFQGCTALKTFDLSGVTEVPVIGGANIFVAGSPPQIPVPSALYDAFMADTYWASYAANIVPV